MIRSRQPQRGRLVGRRVERAGEHDPVARDPAGGAKCAASTPLGIVAMRSDGSSSRDLARVLVGHQHDALERPVGARLQAPHRALLLAAATPAPRPVAALGLGVHVAMPRVERRDHAPAGHRAPGRSPRASRASRARRRSDRDARTRAGARARTAPRAGAPRPARAAPARRRAAPTHAPEPGRREAPTRCSSMPAGGGAVLVGMPQREHGQLSARGQTRAQLVQRPGASRSAVHAAPRRRRPGSAPRPCWQHVRLVRPRSRPR